MVQFTLDIKPLSSKKKWTLDDIEFLKQHYPTRGKIWCCKQLGKSEASVRAKASELKLRLCRNTAFYADLQKRAGEAKRGKLRPRQSAIMKRYATLGRLPALTTKRTKLQKAEVSQRMRTYFTEHGHPRGMAGKRHTQSTRVLLSEASKRNWGDKSSRVNSKQHRQLLSDRMSKLQAAGVYRNQYSRGRMGTYDINGKDVFFRSLWEANYALYLDFLIRQRQIKAWQFEVDTFWFEKIRRGVRSYKPDFKVFNNDGSVEYHEVKGWMDAKSQTKLKRMAKYHPSVKIVLVDQTAYYDIKKAVGKLIKFYV